MSPQVVLVIDEVAETGVFLKDRLSGQEGVTVEVVKDPRRGLEAVKKHQPVLVVLGADTPEARELCAANSREQAGRHPPRYGPGREGSCLVA